MSLICQEHQKEFTLFCTVDNQMLCSSCRYMHKSISHNIIDLQGGQTIMAQTIPNLSISFRQDAEEVNKLAFPRLAPKDGGLKAGLEQIDHSKQQLI